MNDNYMLFDKYLFKKTVASHADDAMNPCPCGYYWIRSSCAVELFQR